MKEFNKLKGAAICGIGLKLYYKKRGAFILALNCYWYNLAGGNDRSIHTDHLGKVYRQLESFLWRL